MKTKQKCLNEIYPIGSIFQTPNKEKPEDLMSRKMEENR